MKKISFNQGTLTIDQNKITFEVPVQKIMINSAQELEPIFQQADTCFPCEIQLSSDMLSMVFTYQVGTEFVPFLQARLFDRSVRLAIVDQLVRLGYYFDTQERLATVFQPINFFTDGQGRVKILYQGLKGLMPAEGYDQESLFDQARRLSLLLFSEAQYDELRIKGLKLSYQKAFSGERRWVKQILQANDFNELIALISNERAGLNLPTQSEEQSILPFITPEEQQQENNPSSTREHETNEISSEQPPNLLLRPSSLHRTQPPGYQESVEEINMLEPSIQPIEQTKPSLSEKKVDLSSTSMGYPKVYEQPSNETSSDNKSISTKIAQSISQLRGNQMVFTFTLISIGSVFFVILLYMILQSRVQADTQKPNEMTRGLYLAAIQQYTDAIKHFEKLEFADLNKEEQQAVIFSYLRANQFDKILKLNPQYLDIIIAYLERTEQEEKIQKITVNTPEVEFEKAAVMKDIVEMERLQDQVKMDLRRKKKLIDGYFLYNNQEKARIYAEQSQDEQLIKYYQDQLPISGPK